MGLLKKLLKATGNENAAIASDGLYSDKTAGWIDTGSYAFNAAICASIYGGIPKDKIIGLAGEEATGKSFYALAIADNFLKDNPTGEVCIFDTEHAISKTVLAARGMDLTRIAVSPVNTVEDFSHESLSLLNEYESVPAKERVPLMLILDSLGNLSTKKELRDIASGSDTKDMTRTQMIKAAFRVLTIKLGVLGVPMIVTGHVYQSIGGLYPTKVLGGGAGLKYAASSIAFLSKAQDKMSDGTRRGSIITVTMEKSRFSREKSRVKTRLTFDEGLDRYYGLADMAVAAGIWKKNDKYIHISDTEKTQISRIESNPEKYFTKEVLDAIDNYAQKAFAFGSPDEAPQVDLDVEGSGEE